MAITNVEVRVPWAIQRIGKKATVVEHNAGFKATYGDDDRYSFEIMMSGFGAYKDNTKDVELSYVSSISGNFAGTSVAPWYVKAGTCTACYVEPAAAFMTTALDVCESCAEGLSESSDSEYTPFYGTYSVNYDSGKSKACAKSGLS